MVRSDTAPRGRRPHLSSVGAFELRRRRLPRARRVGRSRFLREFFQLSAGDDQGQRKPFVRTVFRGGGGAAVQKPCPAAADRPPPSLDRSRVSIKCALQTLVTPRVTSSCPRARRTKA